MRATPCGYCYPVSHLYRTFEKQYQSGYKIGGDILQSEPDTDREQTEYDRESRKIDPHELKGYDDTGYHNYIMRRS